MKFLLFSTAASGIWFWVSILFFILLIVQQSWTIADVYNPKNDLSQFLRQKGLYRLLKGSDSAPSQTPEPDTALGGYSIFILMITILTASAFVAAAVEVNKWQALNPFRGLGVVKL